MRKRAHTLPATVNKAKPFFEESVNIAHRKKINSLDFFTKPQVDISKKSDNNQIQRMAECPDRLSSEDPTPTGWQAYHGNPKWFHCGFRGILEDRLPTPEDPQNECFYDHAGRLVDENHEYAGCGGTPNQYDSDQNPGSHTFLDSGGILRAGSRAFHESRRYERDRMIEDFRREGRKIFDWRQWVNLGR